jgi:hypothetical protein
MHMRELYGNFNTGTVELRIYSVSRNEWIDNLPLAAWDTKHCDGPLTIKGDTWDNWTLPIKPN